MQVSNPNNVKIYNLSAGKSLPEWLSDRRKRTLQKQDVDIRRRIELIQDFEMPTVSNCIQISRDRQYIYTTGVYKPRVRCYDLNQLSMKFERCFDSEVVKFINITDDYSKLVFLQADRFIEFHSQHGKYYKIRIPKNGRDLSYHDPSCDLYFVGASSEIYRLNLEQGRFLNPLKTEATEVLCCQFNPVHQLFACGTKEGHVECWDPRTRNRVGKLDCAFSKLIEDHDIEGVPAVQSLTYKDGLTMGVGLSTGQILLYDMRSDKPLLIKDHMYGFPIKDLHFHESQDLVTSIDSRICKIWNRHTGKAFTSIEPETALNDLAVFPDSGMLFLANEAPKVLTYYIPSVGPAPKWCSFLDNLTEELEENATTTVYDDYKFVTRTELEELGLTQHIGSSLLRAYMHGYFMDIRLYNKAKTLAEPFAYDDYRRKKIAQKIEEARKNRVQVKRLPKVNRVLAEKLIENRDGDLANKKTKKGAATLLEDDRFKKIFEDADFQVDPESEEYRLINPVVSKLDKQKKKKQKAMDANFEEVEASTGGRYDDSDSSDDDHTWTAEVKKQHKMMQNERREKKPRFFALKEGVEASSLNRDQKKKNNLQSRALGDRLAEEEDSSVITQRATASGGMEMTFKLKQKTSDSSWKQRNSEHHAERRKIRRSTAGIIKPKQNPQFFKGRRGK